MTETNIIPAGSAVPGRTTLTTRGASRKLLARKATARAADEHGANRLEDVFPTVSVPDGAAEDVGRAPAESGSNNADACTQPDATPEPEHGGPDHAAAEAIADPAAAEPSAAAPANPSVIASPEPESALSDAVPAAPAPLSAPTPAWSEADESALNVLLARRRAAGYQRRGRDVGGQLIRLGDVTPNPDTVVAVIVGLVAQAGGSVSRAELLDMMAVATFPHPKARPSDRGWSQGYVQGAVRSGFLASDVAGKDLVKARSVKVGGGDPAGEPAEAAA